MKKVIPFNYPRAAKGADTGQAVAEAPGADLHDQNSVALGLTLAQRLLGCANTRELLQRFSSWAMELGLADGMDYLGGRPRHDVSARFGAERHHRARYELQLQEHDLGTLTLFRRQRYTERELLCIEQGLGALASCLRLAEEFASLQTRASEDPLTGLGNRDSLQYWMGRELSRVRRHDSLLSVLMIDVDHFRDLNNGLGHPGGDRVLRVIADVFRRSTRASDLLFRYGGDEFTILMPHTREPEARLAAAQIRRTLLAVTPDEFGIDAQDVSLRPDISVGIAGYVAGDDEDSLLQRADSNLYRAKSLGRGRVCSSV